MVPVTPATFWYFLRVINGCWRFHPWRERYLWFVLSAPQSLFKQNKVIEKKKKLIQFIGFIGVICLSLVIFARKKLLLNRSHWMWWPNILSWFALELKKTNLLTECLENWKAIQEHRDVFSQFFRNWWRRVCRLLVSGCSGCETSSYRLIGPTRKIIQNLWIGISGVSGSTGSLPSPLAAAQAGHRLFFSSCYRNSRGFTGFCCFHGSIMSSHRSWTNNLQCRHK